MGELIDCARKVERDISWVIKKRSSNERGAIIQSFIGTEMAVFSQDPKAAPHSGPQAAYTARPGMRHVRLAAVLRVPRPSSFAPKVILVPLLRVTYSVRLTFRHFLYGGPLP